MTPSPANAPACNQEEWMTTLSTVRQLIGRPVVPLLAALTVLLAACSSVGPRASRSGT